jgi:hypothetical protein
MIGVHITMHDQKIGQIGRKAVPTEASFDELNPFFKEHHLLFARKDNLLMGKVIRIR